MYQIKPIFNHSLEILPREVGSAVLPDIQHIDQFEADKLLGIVDDYIRNKKNIDELLDIVDKAILVEFLSIKEEVVDSFKGIWKKLINRRLARSK